MTIVEARAAASLFTSLGAVLRNNAANRPDAIALTLGDRHVTWQELAERSGRVASALAALGVEPHDRIAIIDKNTVEHIEVFFGAALLNAVCVSINWRLAAPEVGYVATDATAKVLFVGADFLPVVEAIADDLTATRVIAIGEHSSLTTYEQLLATHEPITVPVPTSASDVAFQLYSSGTTGHPKGVMLSNANFGALLSTILPMWEFRQSMVNLVAMPLFHIGGAGWAMAAMALGARCVLTRDADPEALVRIIPNEGITHAFLVPAVLQFMLAVPDVEQADFSRFEVVVYGASPIAESVLVRSLEVFGASFWQAYGLTETGGTVVNLLPGDHDPAGPSAHRLRSCGTPGPNVELRIVDGDGAEVAQGSVGEILIRTPQVMLGYWRNDSATRDAIDDAGWFRTGDAGYLDADGYLYIHDRVKDMIVSGGENVYPAEIENALMAHPAIADVAVIGVPDDRWGETAKAIVVVASGAAVTEAAVIAFARERLAGFKCPRSVDFVEWLPRNPSGKILKRELREPFWAGRDRRVG